MAFTQEDVNNWFAANPNATQQDVANTVQGLGGLGANPGLADMIGQHYGADAGAVTNAYNTYTAPSAPAAPAPTSVADLYSSVLGRAPDQGGLAYWQQQFGDTIDPNEVATFKAAAAPELAMSNYQAPAAPTAPYTDVVNQWAAKNPNATPSQITQAIQDAGGLTPELANAVAQHYGTTAADVTSQYQTNQGINSLYQTYLGRAPESQDVVNQWAQQFGSTIDPNEIAKFREAAAPELAQTHYLSTPMRGDIQQYVSGVLADNTLTPWEQTNKIMEQAQKAGITQSQIEDVFGKQNVQPYMDTYKKGINDFLTETLAKDPGTTMSEVGAIHKAAQQYGLTPDEIAKYGGLDPKVAQSYFDMYDKGLGTIVSQLNDPKTSDITKTQTALALQQQYGTTDAELAKASNGKYTTEDIKAYLDPVRNVPTNLQKLFNNPDATAADISKVINDARADPRAAAIYGAGLDKMEANLPLVSLRNGVNGSAQGYRDFLAQATATPEASAKYANQIASVQKLLSTAQYDADRYYGGKVQDYQVQLMSPLNTSKMNDPKQLDITPAQYETRTGIDPESGQTYTYQGLASNAKVNNANVTPTYDEDGNVTGYTSSKASNIGGVPVYANYDKDGNVTGYVGQDATRVFYPGGNSGSFSGKWDANGNVLTQYHPPGKSGGFLGSVVSDFASMGPVGMIALAAATGGLGSLAAEAMGGGLLANAAGSGLVSGALSSATGGSFGQGFTGGALGNLAGNYVAGMGGVSNMTGNPMVDNYLKAALPNLASTETRAAINGQNLGDAGIASLLNTGINQGSNALINEAVPNTLTPGQQKVATGVGSGLLTSAITGKPINLENSILNYAIQNAMSAGKQAAKG